MILIDYESPTEVARKIAARVKKQRLQLNLSQEGLAKRALVKLPTYRKFERTGQISLAALLRISFALNCLDDFGHLFVREQYESMSDVMRQNNHPRQRGKRKE